jgi:hypothetical protein
LKQYASPVLACHHPRKRVIQYAAAVELDIQRLGVLDRPVIWPKTRFALLLGDDSSVWG